MQLFAHELLTMSVIDLTHYTVAHACAQYVDPETMSSALRLSQYTMHYSRLCRRGRGSQTSAQCVPVPRGLDLSAIVCCSIWPIYPVCLSHIDSHDVRFTLKPGFHYSS